MQALAQMANGVAPALNDLLTIITGQAGQLLDAATLDAPTRQSVNQIYTAGERAVSLIRQLQLFGGGQQPQLRNVDLNQLVALTEPTLNRLIGQGVAMEIILSPERPIVAGDPAMLEQVLLSLVFNACEALPDGIGKLSVATAMVNIDEANRPSFPEGRTGDFAVLSIADNGSGIPPDLLPRIYEPFLSTKPPGRHPGLGLAAVFGAVQQHQGWIQVESDVGGGSTFQVFLPATAGEPAPGSTGQTEPAPSLGGEAILLVEDDDNVRDLIFALLEKNGYRVLQARSAEEALETWAWHGPRIKLLFTDMVLEGSMSGLDLAKRLRAENPALGVICTSGHSRTILADAAEMTERWVFLQKPCRPQTLIRAVRALLDSP